MQKTFLTAESVCAGHPDKICDYISDSILDYALSKDKYSRVACETMATKGNIIVAGEITSTAEIDIQNIVNNALLNIGYEPKNYKIHIFVHQQSLDIAHGVDNALESRQGDKTNYACLGAGDQGSVYGYATNETEEKLPLPLLLSHNICKNLDIARKNNKIKGLLPDGKAQISIEYENGKPKRINTIIISIQHEKSKNLQDLRKEITENIIYPTFTQLPIDPQTQILINPAGNFIDGGPSADTGLTGRKIMVDTYGGLAAHGGGAFSGKDATKVDRSGAYMARHIAKTIVTADLAEKCEVSISYAIGKADPVSVNVNTFGTGKISDNELVHAINKTFNLRPGAIINYLNLLSPNYAKTSAYGHFSNKNFTWENIDDSIITKLNNNIEQV